MRSMVEGAAPTTDVVPLHAPSAEPPALTPPTSLRAATSPRVGRKVVVGRRLAVRAGEPFDLMDVSVPARPGQSRTALRAAAPGAASSNDPTDEGSA